MKKAKLLKVAASALALTMCVSAFAGCGSKGGIKVPDFSESANIKIGTSGPLTGSASVYGIAVEYSAQLAVKEINDAGGLSNGVKFSFEMTDDQAGTENIGTNYASLKQKGLQVSLGTVTSGSCLEWKTYAKADNLFCLTPSATSDKVPEDADNVYQVCFSDSSQGVAAADFVEENYPDAKVGVLYRNDDDYSKGIYNNFMNNYAKSDTVTSAPFSTNEYSDFSSQIQILKECDFIFLPIYYSPASLFIQQAKGQIADNAVYFGCDGLDGIDTVNNFDVNSFKQEISYLSHFNASSENTKVKAFVDAFKSNFQSEYLNQFGAGAYDCVYAIKDALNFAIAKGKTVDGSVSMSDMCNLLKEVFADSEFKFSGVTGTNMTWNTDGTVSKVAGKFVVNPDRVK